MFRSGGVGTGEGKEKECVVEDTRNKSSQVIWTCPPGRGAYLDTWWRVGSLDL